MFGIFMLWNRRISIPAWKDLYCVHFLKYFVKDVIPIKGYFIPIVSVAYIKISFLYLLFFCMVKLSSMQFIFSVGQVRCSCTDNCLIYSQMQICLFKYMPCLHVYLLVGAIVSLAQKNIALSHIIIHKGSFLSYFCSRTIFMIAI